MKKILLFLCVAGLLQFLPAMESELFSPDTLFYTLDAIAVNDSGEVITQSVEQASWLPLENPFKRIFSGKEQLWIRVPLPAEMPRNPYILLEMDNSFVTLSSYKSQYHETSAAQAVSQYQLPSPASVFPLSEADFQRGYKVFLLNNIRPHDLMRLKNTRIGSETAVVKKAQSMLRSMQISDEIVFFMGNALLLAGVLSLLIFFGRYKYRDYPFLIFGVMTLLSGIISWMTSPYSGYLFSLFHGQRMLFGLGYMLLFVLLIVFIRFLFINKRFWIIVVTLILWLSSIILTVYGHFSPGTLRIVSIFLVLVVYGYVVWCIVIDRRFDLRKKIILGFGFTTFFAFIFLHTSRIIRMHNNIYSPFGAGFFILAAIFTYFLFDHLIKAERELEEKRIRLMEIEQQNLVSQLSVLKNQIDPHFLFNNFNTLLSLIESDPAVAAQFVEELAQVYRYILQIKDKDTITLEEELAFTRSYVYLLRTRFRENFSLDVQIPQSLLTSPVLPFCIQTLVENAVKHNRITADTPLVVTVEQEGDFLKVTNPLQRKRILNNSSGIGLDNLRKRYRFFTRKPFIIQETRKVFVVKLPLLQGDV